MKLTLVAGARPNFLKISPIIQAILKEGASGKNIDYRLVHTGQHYDHSLSQSFFDDLGIPAPHVNLKSGSGSHGEQSGNIMVGMEKELSQFPTDLVLVVGDVNSTLACSVVSKKMNTPVAHVEAGIRSFDMTMPEEINRRVTDSISDLFFTTTELAGEQLKQEGVSEKRIFLVGNTMIDSLVSNLEKFPVRENLDESEKYYVLTLHRPSNVDDPESLKNILEQIEKGIGSGQVIFPVHPRTAPQLKKIDRLPKFEFVDPLGYLDFMGLVKNSSGVITDSGGIQEETTFLGIPCLTLRENTERPETVDVGTNILIGNDWGSISEWISKMAEGKWKTGKIPPLWDGNTADRIIEILIDEFEKHQFRFD